MSLYAENLLKTIIINSESDIWEDAVQEWEIVDWEEDYENNSSCICGKEKIRYLYTIHNRETDRTLFPIGSRCIKKFERKDLNEQVEINKKLFQLIHAIENNSYIYLNSQLFSRKLLRYLYEDGAFSNNKYNNYNSENDYEFLLEMFNKRNEPTINQSKKINAIMVNSIRPYLLEKLRIRS